LTVTLLNNVDLKGPNPFPFSVTVAPGVTVLVESSTVTLLSIGLLFLAAAELS
jgi:hypothetical protein